MAGFERNTRRRRNNEGHFFGKGPRIRKEKSDKEEGAPWVRVRVNLTLTLIRLGTSDHQYRLINKLDWNGLAIVYAWPPCEDCLVCSGLLHGNSRWDISYVSL